MPSQSLLRPILKQRGTTLIEALVAAAILGSVVVLVAQYNSSSITSPVHQDLTYGNACQNYAQSILGAVQEETYYRELYNYVPNNPGGAPTTRILKNSAPQPFTTDRAVNDISKWWQLPTKYYDVSEAPLPGAESGGTTLQNFQLINGSLRTLSEAYNSTSGVRCAFSQNLPAMLSIPGPPTLLAGSTVKMQLKPYDANGTELCTKYNDGTTAPLIMTPLEAAPADPKSSAFAAGSAFLAIPLGTETYLTAPPAKLPPAAPAGWTAANRPAWVSTDAVGIEMSVRVEYTQNGALQACNVSQKFEYPRDRSPPPRPTATNVTVTSNPSLLNQDCKANSTGPFVFKLGYDNAASSMERGFALLCRDLSWQNGWTPDNGSIHISPPCIEGSPLGIDTDKHPATSSDPSNQGTSDPDQQDFSKRQKTWVPCDLLQQCGVTPSSAQYTNGAGDLTLNTVGANHTLTLSYSNLPTGCNMNFEVMTVDSAGNTSVNGSDANRVFLSKSSTIDPAIHQNTCGYYCNPSTIAYYTDYPGYANYPNGYYTCSTANPTCCVGAGCTPLQ